VFVVDPEREPASVAALLHRTYQVTPAEARLAEILMSGRDLDAACEELGVTRNTVRTQLKQLFEKLGVKRQAELVALLLRIASPLPRGF
jgi:DNA-binding CsgD family transcriptional regulator